MKEQLELELEELGSIREMQVKESEASGKISGLEKKIQYADIEKVTSVTNLYIMFSVTLTWLPTCTCTQIWILVPVPKVLNVW